MDDSSTKDRRNIHIVVVVAELPESAGHPQTMEDFSGVCQTLGLSSFTETLAGSRELMADSSFIGDTIRDHIWSSIAEIDNQK